MSNVTVLADAKLNGIEREYAEVKRMACAGERIKFNRKENGYTPGTVYETYAYPDGALAGGAVFKDDDGHIRWPEHNQHGYVVLEPTGIVRIAGVRYRMVERKANVGETITPLKSNQDCTAGRPYVVTELSGSMYTIPHFIDDIGDRWHLHSGSFAVLEPVESAIPIAPTSDLQRTVDGLTDAVANLARRLTEAERKLAELEPKEVADDQLPSFITRDNVVEQAKRDVAELEITERSVHKNGRLGFWPYKDSWTTYIPMDDVEFVVNREKRTVAALIKYREKGRVWTRGIAKCTPDDVFNVHIGKAIALRRARGLEIPVEYVKTPQPGEVRVGDIVKWTCRYDDKSTDINTVVRIESDGDTVKYRLNDGLWDQVETLKVIDDSRTVEHEEVTAA